MPPSAVKVAVEPKHIAVGLELAVTVGLNITVIAMVFVAIQPKAVVPDTVYTVLVIGLTVTVVPIEPPGFQV